MPATNPPPRAKNLAALPPVPAAAALTRLAARDPARRRTLTIETASARGGVGVTGHEAGGSTVVRAFSTEHAHAREMINLIDAALAEVGFEASELDLIVVDAGPGSHTGVRVGLVTARLLAWQFGCAVRGVCSLDVLADSVCAELSSDTRDVLCLAALPCRRGELYVRDYRAIAGVIEPVGDARTISDDEAGALLTAGCALVGDGWRTRPLEEWRLDRLAGARLLNVHGWPTVEATAAHGRRIAATELGSAGASEHLDDLAREWQSTLAPRYLRPPLARTVAERRDAASAKSGTSGEERTS